MYNLDDLIKALKAGYGNFETFMSTLEKEMMVKNPVWDEEVLKKYCKAILIALDLFGDDITFTDPKEPSCIHSIGVDREMITFEEEQQLELYRQLISLCDCIDMSHGNDFVSLSFGFECCKEEE